MDCTSQQFCLQLAPTVSCPGASPPFLCMYMYKRVTSVHVTGHVTRVTTPVMSIKPQLWASRPSYECHTLLRACGVWLLQIMHVRCLSSYGFPSNKHGVYITSAPLCCVKVIYMYMYFVVQVEMVIEHNQIQWILPNKFVHDECDQDRTLSTHVSNMMNPVRYTCTCKCICAQ